MLSFGVPCGSAHQVKRILGVKIIINNNDTQESENQAPQLGDLVELSSWVKVNCHSPWQVIQSLH